MKRIGKIITKALYVASVAFLLWIVVSTINVDMNNLGPDDGDPADWNFYVVMLEDHIDRGE